MGCRGFGFPGALAVGRAVWAAGPPERKMCMRSVKRRALSLLLVLVMVLGLLPSMAWAGEAEQAYVTISVAGELKTKQLPVALSDEDKDGTVTVNDVLIAAHDAAYPGGAGAGYGSEYGSYGLSMTKLWGDTSGNFGYWKNDQSCWSLTDPVSAGDFVTAFVNRLWWPNNDLYSYFDVPRTSVIAGEELTLTLSKVTYDASYNPVPQPMAGAQVAVENQAGDPVGEHQTTDGQGQVVLILPDPGIYTASASYYDADLPACIVPAVCTVEVLEKSPDNLVAAAADQLTWDAIRGSNTDQQAVTEDLAIPSVLQVAGEEVSVSWACDDTTYALSVSNYDGPWKAYVDRPASQDVSCTLTATLSYGGASAAKSIPITVKAEGIHEDKETVVAYSDLLTGISASYTASQDPWTVLDMAAYNGQSVKAAEGYDPYASAAASALAEAAVGGAVSQSTLDGVDISGSYAIYTIPYLSLAYQAAGLSDQGADRLAEMKAAMVDYLENREANYAGVDEVTPVLAALAPYYKQGDAQVDGAVDATVTWLSEQQGADGTFSYYGTSNANSTAMAVVALSALGIDAHTDSRFIKNSKSAVEGLFSFALADHSGFGYKGNVTLSELSTEQGFRALVSYARFQEAGKAYNIYLQAKNSQSAVAAPEISTTVTPPEEGGGSGSGSTTYRITVSVMVPPEGGQDGQYTYRYDSAQYTNLLGGTKTVTVKKNTTALEVLTDVLKGENIPYQLQGSYVKEIGGLAEEDHGPNSGWQYMVDGTAPTESAGSYVFTSSAKLVWYYTDDYTKEKSADAWSGSTTVGGASIGKEAEVEKKADGSYAVTLPEDSKGPVLVTLPGGKEGQLVVIVGSDGKETVVKKSALVDGKMTLLLEKDAILRLVDYSAGFADVAQDAWYSQAVDFVTGRGLFSGVDEDSFAPQAGLSRGMLVTVLYALEEPDGTKVQADFADVAAGDWYAAGAAWAAEEGIVSGYGDGRFGPNDLITREQLAVMLWQYAKSLGMNTSGRASLSGFADAGEVSSWAEEALSWSVKAGLLSGRADGTLDPGGSATRAEAAVMLRQLVKLMMQ